MKTNKLLYILLSSTIICSLSITLTSCKSNSNIKPSTNLSTNKLEKDADQTLSLPLSNDPETLDPNKAVSAESTTILNAVNEGLLRVKNEDGLDKIVGAGAKSWTTPQDGLVWTFTLRDYNWSDGKPVIAQHFVDSIYRLLDSNNGFYYSYLAFDIKNAQKYYNKKISKHEVGVKAIDDKTLEITLEKPTPYFDKKLVLTPFQPIRLDILTNPNLNADALIDGQVYCGPFKVTNWVKNSSISLEKNLSFWDKDNVYINKVNFLYTKDTSKEANSFENRQLDVCTPNTEYLNKWISNSNNFKLSKLSSPTVFFVQFNENTGGTLGLMKNKNIRKALSLCIDRTNYIDNLTHKHFPAYGVIPNKISLNDKEFRSLFKENLKTQYDDLSKNSSSVQELFKTGLNELNQPNLSLNSISLNMLIFDNGNSNSSSINWWKKTFENKLNITINPIICTDVNIFEQLKKENSYDLTFSSYDGDFNDPLSFLKFWMTSNGFSKKYGGYSNPDFDKTFSKLSCENDYLVRGKIYNELENLLVCEDAALAPYLYKETYIFSQEYAKDIFYPLFGPKIEFRWSYISGKVK